MNLPQFIAACEATAQVLADGLANPLEVRDRLAELESARRKLFSDGAEWGGFEIKEIDAAEYVALRDGVAGNYWDGWIFDGQLNTDDKRELCTMFAAVLRSWAGRARELQATETKRGRPKIDRVTKQRDFIAKHCMNISDSDIIQTMLLKERLGRITPTEINSRKAEIRKAQKGRKV